MQDLPDGAWEAAVLELHAGDVDRHAQRLGLRDGVVPVPAMAAGFAQHPGADGADQVS